MEPTEPTSLSSAQYKEVLFGALQSEQEYAEERNRFANLFVEGTEGAVSFAMGEEMYDTRKILTSMEARYAGGKQVPRKDYQTVLTLGSTLLLQENAKGFIPVLIRAKETSDIVALKHHPRWYLKDLILQRFMNEEEFVPHTNLGPPDDVARDLHAAINFCLAIHSWNTQYYNRYPSVGVLFSEDSPGRKKFRAGEQANHLVWWRGLPFEICTPLLELGFLDMLDDDTRGPCLEKIIEMCIGELFDESYFGQAMDPPRIPRYAEPPPRRDFAEQLLSMVIGIYGKDLAVVQARDRYLENENQQYSEPQMHRLENIFFGEEIELTPDQLKRIAEITQEKEKPSEN